MVHSLKGEIYNYDLYLLPGRDGKKKFFKVCDV